MGVGALAEVQGEIWPEGWPREKERKGEGEA